MSNPEINNQFETMSPNPPSPLSDNSIFDNATDAVNGEVKIRLEMKCVINITLEKSTTIKDLKNICRREGISENLLEAIHDGNNLQNDSTLEECGVEDNSTVSLVVDSNSVNVRRLFVRIPSNPQSNTSMIVANAGDTISTVKSLVVAKTRLNPEHHELMFNGRFLATHETLEALNVPNNSTLYLVELPPRVNWIYISTPSNGIVPLQISPLQTIGYSKSILGGTINLPMEQAVLLFEGQRLDETRTFASYNVAANMMLHLEFKFEVYARLWNGRTIALHVLPSDDANEINKKIAAKLNMPYVDFALFHLGEYLEIGQAIASYGVTTNSIIRVGNIADYP